MSRSPRAALTLDVDSMRCYRAIHGLSDVESERDPIYLLALPRFFDLLASQGVPATLFLIGADAPRFASAFQPARETGCEIANHSFSHDYRLSTRSAAEIQADLEQAHRALLPLSPTGSIVGLRAPGYNTCEAMLAAAARLGYRYDSSLLPSPPYFLARATAIGLYSLLGRPSRSLRGQWRAYAGPLAPYPLDLGQPWRTRAGSPLLELPITCEPFTRLPLLGTNWPWLNPRMARGLLARILARVDYVNFEMHAIDLLDSTDPGVDPRLARVQPGLNRPVADKLRSFAALFRQLRESTTVQTLASLTEALRG